MFPVVCVTSQLVLLISERFSETRGATGSHGSSLGTLEAILLQKEPANDASWGLRSGTHESILDQQCLETMRLQREGVLWPQKGLQGRSCAANDRHELGFSARKDQQLDENRSKRSQMKTASCPVGGTSEMGELGMGLSQFALTWGSRS
jgi:hypothetical protein